MKSKTLIIFLSALSLLISSCETGPEIVEVNSDDYEFSYTIPKTDYNDDEDQKEETTTRTPYEDNSPDVDPDDNENTGGDTKDDGEKEDEETILYASPDLPNNFDLSLLEGSYDEAYYESLAIYYAMEEIKLMGLSVFRAYAVIPSDSSVEEEPDTFLLGIAFTDGSIYSQDDDGIIYSCGFMQIVDRSKDNPILLTTEIAEQGVAVISTEDSSTHYIIESNTTIDGFSAISNGIYFSYKQTGTFTIDIEVKEATDNIEDYADPDLDLYDYDNEEYLYQASIFEGSTIGSYAIYGDSALAYQNAVSAINKAIETQDENGTAIGLNSFLVFSLDFLNYNKGSIQDYISNLDNLELEQNQYLVATKDGYGVATDYGYDTSSTRRTSGIIKTLTSLAMIGGGFILITVTGGTATPLVAGLAIATGVSSIIYGTDQLIQGLQMVVDNDESPKSENSQYFSPLKYLLSQFMSDVTAEKVYNLGLAITGLSAAFLCPINKALEVSKTLGAGAFSTVINVARAVAVQTAKLGITALATKLTSIIVSDISTSLGFSEAQTIFAQYAASVIAAFLVYHVLNSIDSKLDLSGFNRKNTHVRPASPEEIAKARAELEAEQNGDKKLSNFKLKKKTTKTDTDTDDAQKFLEKEKHYYTKRTNARSLGSYITYEYDVNTQDKIAFYQYTERGYSFLRKASEETKNTDLVAGFYDYKTKTIYVDFDKTKDDDLLMVRTIAHLLRHAYQFENAEKNSPILNALLKENYTTPDGYSYSYVQNVAEQDAEAFADYIEERVRNACKAVEENPDIDYVENTLAFADPDTFMGVVAW